MDLERWQNLRRLLDRALELNIADRRAFVASQCGDDAALAREAYSMLAAYESGGDLLEAPVARLSFGPGHQPTRVGPYRISETLGEGGMGVVYLGHRDDETFEKEVALKVLRRHRGGPELQRRFALERQILADLEHPYIARLLDGGTTDQGLPFLVIERVDGRPIDAYCRAKDLGVEQRLELVLKVCEAIQYAHRNLVVHRDLKPSNILITEEGDPKLLDFGIAKILHPETFSDVAAPQTRTGILPMTPEYAGPEQVQGGAVTTATDVYALGLLIYELLCDRRPYDFSGKSLQAMVDLVCRQVPVKPSVALERQAEAEGSSAAWAKRRSRRLAGDLDAIVMRALRKDPAERYGSVAQLADDLRRFLNGRPVEARRSSMSYVLWKFVRRHRWAVGSVVAVFLVLVGFIAVVLGMQHQIVDERDRTLHERNRAEQVSGWLTELFELPAPSRSKGENVTARELLSKSVASIDDELQDLQLKAVLLSTLGSTHVKLGLLREGVELLTRSVRLTRRVESGDSDLLRERLKRLSEALTLQGELRRAEVVARELLARLQQGSRNRSSAEASLALARLGHLRNLLGDAEAAGELLGRARVAAGLAADPLALAKVLEYSGDERMRQGDPAQAVEHYSRALELLLGQHGELHPDVVLLKSSLAAAVKGFDLDRAEKLFEEAIADQRRLFDDAHPVLATALNNLGLLHLERGRYARAEPWLAEAVAMQEKLYGDRHPKYAVMLGNLANAERFLGRSDAAERRMRQAIEIFETRLGGEHGDLALALANLAELLLALDRLEEATVLIYRADAMATKAFRGAHPHRTSILNTLGQIEWRNGDLQTASDIFKRAVEHADRALGSAHSTLPAALANLADAQRRLGRKDEAVASMERALALIAEHGELDRRRLQWLTWLADLELESGRFSSAEEHGRAAYEGWARVAGPSDVWTLSVQKVLGNALMELGRLDEAEALTSSLIQELEAGGPSRAKRLKAARELLAEIGRKRSGSLN